MAYKPTGRPPGRPRKHAVSEAPPQKPRGRSFIAGNAPVPASPADHLAGFKPALGQKRKPRRRRVLLNPNGAF